MSLQSLKIERNKLVIYYTVYVTILCVCRGVYVYISYITVCLGMGLWGCVCVCVYVTVYNIIPIQTSGYG